MKAFTLCISPEKLRQLKSGKSSIVSHVNTALWESFYNKKLQHVKFLERKFYDSHIFYVESVEKIVRPGETIIKIKIAHEKS